MTPRNRNSKANDRILNKLLLTAQVGQRKSQLMAPWGSVVTDKASLLAKGRWKVLSGPLEMRHLLLGDALGPREGCGLESPRPLLAWPPPPQHRNHNSQKTPRPEAEAHWRMWTCCILGGVVHRSLESM